MSSVIEMMTARTANSGASSALRLRYSAATVTSRAVPSPLDREERRGMIEGIKSVVSDPRLRELAATAIMSAATPQEGIAQARVLIGPVIRKRHDELVVEKDALEVQIADLDRRETVYSEFAEWIRQDLRLYPIGDSLLHKALSDARYMQLVNSSPETSDWKLRADYTTVLVQHDWARAVAGKEADQGDIRLPFEHTALELNISGKRLCVLFDCEDGSPYRMTPLIESSTGWFYPGYFKIEAGRLDGAGDAALGNFLSLAMAQMRAIAICLDADILKSELVRVPAKLNAVRVRNGRVPLYDYHILSLTNRRAYSAATGEHAGRRKRLHFRRGHWRHYPSHKTWIKWMLVGDVSLGFSDKDYRI